eukprot:g83457.t1
MLKFVILSAALLMLCEAAPNNRRTVLGSKGKKGGKPGKDGKDSKDCKDSKDGTDGNDAPASLFPWTPIS